MTDLFASLSIVKKYLLCFFNSENEYLQTFTKFYIREDKYSQHIHFFLLVRFFNFSNSRKEIPAKFLRLGKWLVDLHLLLFKDTFGITFLKKGVY